jgi:hypothetical protein
MASRAVDDKKNKEKARKFVQTRLGRRNDTTFLTELSPVPEKRTGEPKWLAELRTGNLSEKLYMERETRIKDLLKLEKPKCVICYGLGKKKEFAKLLGVDWVELPETDRVFKAPKNSFFLLPFFGQGISHELVKGLVTHPSFLAQ